MKGKGGTSSTTTTTTVNKSKHNFLIMELPEPIVLDILSRLPAKSIFRCKCVCKTWLTLFSLPYFSNLHLSNSPIEFLLRGSCPKTLLLTQLDESPITTCDDKFRIGRKFMIDLKMHDNQTNQIKVCSSLDGLICFCENKTNSYYVYNPLTGQNVVVPQCGIKGSRSLGCWLGISGKSNEYKLLKFVSNTSVDAFILTLGTNSWRSIALTPRYINLNSSYAPFVNGALHWVNATRGYGRIGCDSEVIFLFDFEEEKFGQVPAPDDYYSGVGEDCDFGKRYFANGLGVLGGCLSLCYSLHFKGVYELWVMNEYGIKESWTKLFVIPHKVGASCYQPIRLMGNGEILVLCDNRIVFSYDPNKKRRRHVKFYGNGRQRYSITPHVPSFVKVLK
ncbi:hypothetical protein LguiB_033348 [Lonicera macranthoides]